MTNIQGLTDKVAISLSVLCTIHCLALPIIIVFLPSIIAITLQNEVFHYWMLIAVIPISTIALTMGCKKHKRYRVIALGILGLIFMIMAVITSHEYLGEIWEKTLTVIGASFVALGHYKNYRLCQNECKHTD